MFHIHAVVVEEFKSTLVWFDVFHCDVFYLARCVQQWELYGMNSRLCTPESEFSIPCYSSILLWAKLWKILIQNAMLWIMKKSFFNKNNPWKLCFFNEENKSKEIQGKNVLSFTKFVLGGFCPGVFGLGGFCRGVYVRGVFVWRVFVLIPCHRHATSKNILANVAGTRVLKQELWRDKGGTSWTWPRDLNA